MARLSYSAIMSLDGYTADPAGDFRWAAPDEAVHAFVNDLVRPVGTCLLGRRMYEIMAFWETYESTDSPAAADFATIWRAAEKVVFSGTLEQVTTANTTIERSFDPGRVQHLTQRSEADVSIAGPTLAAQAMRAGIVDDVHVVIAPCVVGGGLPAFGPGSATDLTLVDHRTFAPTGMVYLRYAVPSD